MNILAVESSCGETAAAVLADGSRLLSNVVDTRIEIHARYGGVVPELASRHHLQNIYPVVDTALADAGLTLDEIDGLAVTRGPGLIGSLLVGLSFVKAVSFVKKIPYVGVDHLCGHILSVFLGEADERPGFPFVALVASGGHSSIFKVLSPTEYLLLGLTLDDAAGEAFDKVAKLLELGYPGGPIIETLAKQGDEYAYDLPIPMKGRKDLNFSYSGLKTAVRYLIRDLKKKKQIDKTVIVNIAASFQRVAAESLIDRLERAVRSCKPNGVLLGGGVISNLYVRRNIRMAMHRHKKPVYTPYSRRLFSDNAAMIGISAYYQSKRGDFVQDIASLDRLPSLNFKK